MIFENVKEVEISTVNGRLDIEGWDNDHAEVNYTLHGEAEVEVEQKGRGSSSGKSRRRGSSTFSERAGGQRLP